MPGKNMALDQQEEQMKGKSDEGEQNDPGPDGASVERELSLHRDEAEPSVGSDHLAGDHQDERQLHGDLDTPPKIDGMADGR